MTDRQLFYSLWCVLLYVVGTLIYFSLTMPVWFVVPLLCFLVMLILAMRANDGR